MRIAQVGLDSPGWPIVWAEALCGALDTATPPPRHRLVACCDLGVRPHAVRAAIGMTPDEFAAKCGVRRYASVRELLAAQPIDAAFVATRNTCQPEAASQLIDAGVPCYVARPIAACPADALLLMHKAQSQAVPCTGGPTMRCLPHLRAIHRVLRHGRIGAVVSIDVVHRQVAGLEPLGSAWWREPGEGGMVYWLSWPPLETVRWFAGSPIKTIAAFGGRADRGGQGEVGVVHAAGTTQNGIGWSCRILQVEAAAALPSHAVEVCGADGVARACRADRIEVVTAGGAREEAVAAPPGDPAQQEVVQWLDAVSRGSTWHSDLKDLAHTVTACEALRRALRTGDVTHC